MELSEKEYIDVAEKLDAEQIMLEETCIVDSLYEKLLDERIILINDVISELTIDKVVMPLLRMDNDGTGNKITIYINSPGGTVHDGMVVADVIEKLKTPTEVIVLGYAYSMASLILMAGKNNPNVVRKCYPFSSALLHGGSIYLENLTASQAKDYFKFNERYEKRLADFIVSHTNLTADDYAAIERYEAYMDSDEMLEKGLVDEII